MKAILATSAGSVLKDIPKPKLEPYLVLVRVKAAAVNRADLMMLHGASHGGWGGGAESPLGLEFAGEVVEVGADIKDLRVGDRVMAAGSGAFAEYILAFEPQLYRIPESMSYEQAAGLPVALQTMHDAISTAGQLAPGQSVLFQGGGSAVGILGMQIAKFLGAGKVIGTSNTPEHCARLKEFGADIAINTTESDWVEQVLKATDDKGVDLLVDFLAGPYINGSLQATRVGGRMINIGRVAGEQGVFNFDLHNMRRISYIGCSFRMRTPLESLEVILKAKEALTPAMEKGAVHMPVDKIFPLEQAAQAFERMEKNLSFGKIILAID
ncbi:MAG TPA: zinc-binding dehydrogenase [Syntrophorhabdaceae bacterium]|nr:zinc-binding dehydrogenase [Syntrophorhabdaceae bacterium]HPA07231.1 zinc-binding dehydrogenase [Methanoregulaceae archaeon]